MIVNNKHRKPNKSELLQELESIRTSLLEDTEVVNEIASPIGQQTHSDDSRSHTAPLDCQQGLFAENTAPSGEDSKQKSTKQEDTSTAASHTTVKEENPFLPSHVKARLEKERSLYQKEIEEVINAPKKPRPRPIVNTPAEENNSALIDELVSIYLPKIEQDLRERLKQRLNTPVNNA